MALQGSLEDFPLREVLQLLADTSKSGKLHVRGQSGSEGWLWFTDGSIAAFDVTGSEVPSEAIFEMLRMGDGEFSFEAEEVAPESARLPDWDRKDVRPEIDLAQSRLAEWNDIVNVVPSINRCNGRTRLSPAVTYFQPHKSSSPSRSFS